MFSAGLLDLLEQEACQRESITNHFDLITGTSTGGIIALGLGVGIKPEDIYKFYKEHGDRIFAPSWSRGIRSAKYPSKPLEEALKKTFCKIDGKDKNPVQNFIKVIQTQAICTKPL